MRCIPYSVLIARHPLRRTAGRNIFVIDLQKVLGAESAAAFAGKCCDAHLSGVWIRIGRGASPDPNLSVPRLRDVQRALTDAGVALWGWHVPVCMTAGDAAGEADRVLDWLDQARLAGVIVNAAGADASAQFRGGPDAATVYAAALVGGLHRRNCGVAFSSPAQPAQNGALPFKSFLDRIADICPQVLDPAADPAPGLNRSIADYTPLVDIREFASRFRPSGNITTSGDIPFPDVQTCLTATAAFLREVKANGFESHSFWCWDMAPAEIWQLFNRTPA